MAGGRAGRSKLLRILGGGVLVGIVILIAWAYPTIHNLYASGILSTDDSKRTYNGNTVDDLKAIYVALKHYHDSNDQFPAAAHWMDDLKQYIRTSDMSIDEANKKFIDPVFLGQADKFGFALNDAVAGKYKGDIKDPKTPLVFESSDPSRSAHGAPDKLAPNPPHKGGDLAISVDGTILKLQG